MTLNTSTVLGPVGNQNSSTDTLNNPDKAQEQEQSKENGQESDSEEGEQGQTVGDFLLNPMGNGRAQLNQQIEEPITGGSDLVNQVPGDF